MESSTATDDAFEGERGDALADVAFLARSANRVRILVALAEAPASRRALADDTGVSRTTLDRIVNEFEDRHWVERRDDGTYATTATGAALVDAFEPALDAAVALRRLGDAVDWLPRDEHPIDLAHFRDAHVRQPEGGDPVETGRYFAGLARAADEMWVMSEWAPPEALARPMHDEIVGGDLDATFVVTRDVAAQVFAAPERVQRWREMLSTNAETWVVDGPIPCNLYVFDETVLVKASGPDAVSESYGVPIESTNPRVREWALDLFERYRAAATPIEADTLAE
ncbi:helix-turn-helix transcriptional regulator [Halorubellus salinus]|uniref:helix-turn-helix transcriptional regulator n=1 Tax=Halorubellus salinus TaxID=755309 RepID=UPI001D0768DF|nr:winged helix-turn-helix domain-containing protein [Halorubellus salinus]